MEPGGKVLSNAFTFGAVPSAIENANDKAVYVVESDCELVMDVGDLELKLKENSDCKHVLISHMRGKLADMDAVKNLCDKNDAVLLEALGVFWQGEHSGHRGVACAISSQSYKMINSGEGRFLLTDDPEIAAQTAVIADAYEGLSVKHTTLPPLEYFEGKSVEQTNYSIRMSNLAATIIRPQIKTLDECIEKYNIRYNMVVYKLQSRVGDHLVFPR